MQMSRNALQIETGRNGHMVQMRFGLPLVGSPSQSRRAHGLRDRAFYPRTSPILLHKGGTALHGSPLPQGGMHLWWPQGEGTPLLPLGTQLAHRAVAAGGLSARGVFRDEL